MLSSFTLISFQTFVVFILLLNTKGDILKTFEESKQLLVPTDSHSREINIVEVN